MEEPNAQIPPVAPEASSVAPRRLDRGLPVTWEEKAEQAEATLEEARYRFFGGTLSFDGYKAAIAEFERTVEELREECRA